MKKGFTLIELLVVIAIIGLLSSIVLASLGAARSKARDSKRISEIKSLQLALELYYDDNGHYPISSSCGSLGYNTGWCDSNSTLSSEGFWIKDGTTPNVLQEYLSTGIKDPQQGDSPYWESTGNWKPIGGGGIHYFSSEFGGSGEWYMIVFGVENLDHTIQLTDESIDCLGNRRHYGSGSDGVITIGGECRL